MKNKVLHRTARCIAVLLPAAALVGSTAVLAEDPPLPMHFAGLINDYVPASVSGGPWEVRGKWSLDLREEDGTPTASFSAAVTMETPSGASAHTHHFSMTGATVSSSTSGCPSFSPPTSGFAVSGMATITANGGQAPFAPNGETSPLTVCVLGGTKVEFSNVTLQLQPPASNHFGLQAIHGVVVKCSWFRGFTSADCAVSK